MPRAVAEELIHPQMSATYRPLLDFMIVGAQKCGTTALARFLAQHPGIRVTSEKEPHVFDAPDYSPDWTPEQIDARYRPFFSAFTAKPIASVRTWESGTEGTRVDGNDASRSGAGGSKASREEQTGSVEDPAARLIRGEATPIYLFLPEIAPELERYNPNLKVIVLLRDPVERAISQYYMERNKGYERRPLWLALLLESWRLRRCGNPRGRGSAWRRHSYRHRGKYGMQLRNLFEHFDAARVMVVRTEDLARRHDEVLRQVFAFLGVEDQVAIEAQTVFEGERSGRRHLLVSLLLRLYFLPELVHMRQYDIAGFRK